jgi:hypothetical protein
MTALLFFFLIHDRYFINKKIIINHENSLCREEFTRIGRQDENKIVVNPDDNNIAVSHPAPRPFNFLSFFPLFAVELCVGVSSRTAILF